MGYFKDDKGNKSMTRLLVFIAAIVAYVISLATVTALIYFNSLEDPNELPTTSIVPIITSLLAYAGLKKVFQKREETKL